SAPQIAPATSAADEGATAAVPPPALVTPAAKRQSGSHRANRKSQQIQPMVAEAPAADALPTKAVQVPVQPPAQGANGGLSGGTLRQRGAAATGRPSISQPSISQPSISQPSISQPSIARPASVADKIDFSKTANNPAPEFATPAPAPPAKPATTAPPPVLRYSQPVPPPGSGLLGHSDVQPVPSPRPVPAPPPPNQQLCTQCRAPVPSTNAFCGSCGAVNPHHSSTLPMPQASIRSDRVGYVALIDDNGGESVQFPIAVGENRIGSGEACQLRFPDDGFLARLHCVVEADTGRAMLRPVDHSNGVFLRITTPVELHHGEVVRIGQEILRFERFDRLVPEVNSDGLAETVGWQPPRGVWGRLCQLGLSRQVANAYLLTTPDVFLGRERGDILFPRDGFVSGSHAVLSDRSGRSFLKDLGSSNGTFVKVKHDTPLRNGDLFLLGRNLLRVHLGSPG
ncbi:MAG: FHA domain-containing protein, partial [Deltaproteobacteria bacterium]|nr:FHA domain-containing protein [Deltaproteobacteria bacterium]